LARASSTSSSRRAPSTSWAAHAHVQPHDAAARGIAGGSRNYQRTLEEKVVSGTKELEVATAHAYKLAQHDILTGLPNRALLNQRLKQILAQSQRNGTHVACLFLDFDHFKRINDTLGHDAGDQLLQAVAQRLTAAVRESDTVARLGGDEFVVILPGLDPAHATFETMTGARALCASRSSRRSGSPTRRPTLTCSIGVSMYPLDAADTVTLIKQADTAMYAAKEVGRNAYRFYTGGHERARPGAAAARDRTCGAACCRTSSSSPISRRSTCTRPARARSRRSALARSRCAA
jgi:diguanylate cyclase (GGDEF)-like protein